MKGFEYLMRFLDNEGYRRKDEGEGLLTFKFEGNTYFVFTQDSRYLQVILVLDVDGCSKSQMLEACNVSNNRRFVVKFTVHDTSVWCSYEFKPSDATTNDEYASVMRTLKNSADDFFEQLKK